MTLPPLPPIPVGALTDGEAALLRAWAEDYAAAAVQAERAGWMSAVSWALGTAGEFREQRTTEGRYWWRGELAERCGLFWNGERWMDRTDCDAIRARSG